MAEARSGAGSPRAVLELRVEDVAAKIGAQKRQAHEWWTRWAGDAEVAEDSVLSVDVEREPHTKFGKARKRMMIAKAAAAAASGGGTPSRKRPRRDMLLIGGAVLSSDELARHIRDVYLGFDRYRVPIMLVIRRMYEHRGNKGIFNAPVDPVSLNIPNYFDVIKNPMDLGTVKRKMEQGEYDEPKEVARDIRLTFENAISFNPSNSYVYKIAKTLLKMFNKEWSGFEKATEKENQAIAAHSCDKCRGTACGMCGQKCLQYQEPILRCSAPCKARISRGATYYRLGGERGQHWCNRCYGALNDQFIGILGQQVNKIDLERCVHDQVFFEPWIDCSRCNRRLHQTCTLYHPSIETPQQRSRNGVEAVGSTLVCALCVAELNHVPTHVSHSENGSSGIIKAEESNGFDSNSWSGKLSPSAQIGGNLSSWAESLPHTQMGKYIEDRVRAVVAEAYASSSSDADGEAFAKSLTLRVVSNIQSSTQYEARILRWIMAQRRSCGLMDDSGVSDRFSCRCKTILLFKRIDGVDVIIFVLYVQEYGRDAPMPNRNKVYISYLDSVAYMNPAAIRTKAYQEIMVAYLTWVNARGFEHAYIWACPPQRGDAYIMYCHPKWQRTPGAERLRKWYADIIESCKNDGTVLSESNFYETHLADFKPLLNTRASRHSHQQSGYGNNSGSSILSPRTKAALLHVDTRAESLYLDSPYESLPYFYGDYLPNETEGLLTMLLNPYASAGATCDESICAWWRNVWGPETKAVLVHKDNRPKVRLVDARPPSTTPSKTKDGREASPARELAPVSTPTWRLAPSTDLDQCDLSAGWLSPQQRNDWLMRRLAASIKPMSENFMVLKLNPLKLSDPRAPCQRVTKLGSALVCPDTSDPDPVLPTGIFDTRLEFLDMCKHNHFQFDSLRRAKLSSLVLLSYHKNALRKTLLEAETQVKVID